MDTAQELHTRFNPRYDQIAPVRIKRFKRHDLSLLFAELGFTRGAEIGVSEGIHARDMLESIPNLHLTGVDPYTKYHWKHSQEEHERCYRAALDVFGRYPEAYLWREASLGAALDMPNESLDFVYIDGDHSFDAVMLDLILWGAKVRQGGIISGHDYYRFRGAGVVDAVNTYTHCHQVHEWFVCDERECDFFWAKP